MNWHARMIYPYEAGTGSNGHYDLQFDGTYELDTITYTDPVFSYADEGGTGYLYVFDKSLTVAIYTGFLPFSGYHYNETSYSASTTAFTDLNAYRCKELFWRYYRLQNPLFADYLVPELR